MIGKNKALLRRGNKAQKEQGKIILRYVKVYVNAYVSTELKKQLTNQLSFQLNFQNMDKQTDDK